MCDHNEFVLCSCDGENLPADKIGWMLERKDANKMMQFTMGMPAMTFLNTKEKGIKFVIAELLNSKNCFDFEYQPQEDDFLEIRTGEGEYKWYAYRFVAGKWKEDDSVSFDGWRTQLVKYKNGKIAFNLRTLELDGTIAHPATAANLSEAQQMEIQKMQQKVQQKMQKFTQMDVKTELELLKELYDMGVLTEEEFTAQKKKILNFL